MVLIKRLVIIGVGLIGGSLARALKAAGAVGEVVGCGRNEVALRRAQELGVIDHYHTDITEAVAGADMVVVAVPVGAMEDVFRAIGPHLASGAVLTDVGSTKGNVVTAAQVALGQLPPGFVPGHPIAGTEKSGVEASFAELYEGRRVILTPLQTSSAEAVGLARAMWETCGAQVTTMSVQHHDEVLAATSHLPHLLAFGLVDALAKMDESEEIFDYAAGGFRDFTRIASSDPRMWHDICLANSEALLAILAKYTAELDELAEAIRRNDGEFLMQIFQRAKQARDRFCG